MDFSSVSFIVATCIAGVIYFNASIQPHTGSEALGDTESHPGSEKPAPRIDPVKKDTLAKLYIPQFFIAHGYLALFGVVYFLTIIPRFVPSRLSIEGEQIFSTLSDFTCPNANNLNPRNFTWNLGTAFNLLAVILGGCLRLEAFAQLGKGFTYELRRPNKLVTSGLYQYLQHPGYTGMLLCWFGMARILFFTDSLPACFLSEGSSWLVGFRRYLPSALHFLVSLWIILVRVNEEEKVLKESFGEKWENWRAVTSRFVPLLF